MAEPGTLQHFIVFVVLFAITGGAIAGVTLIGQQLFTRGGRRQLTGGQQLLA
jgi:hypothetical protein